MQTRMVWCYILALFMFPILGRALEVIFDPLVLSEPLQNCSIAAFTSCNNLTSCEDLVKEYTVGHLNYIKLYFCSFSWLSSAAVIPIVLILIFLFFGLGQTASNYLCPNLHTISHFLHLSDNLAGLTLLAIGNGAPDIFATYTALDLDSGDLALSELTGAALFISTVVVGSMAVVHPFEVTSTSFSKDSAFFMVAVLSILLIAILQTLSKALAIFLILIYVFYVILGVINHSFEVKRSSMHLQLFRTRGDFSTGIELQQPSELFVEESTVDHLLEVTRKTLPSMLTSGHYGINLALKSLGKHAKTSNFIHLEGSDHISSLPALSIDQMEAEAMQSDTEAEIDPLDRGGNHSRFPEGSFLSLLESFVPGAFNLEYLTPLERFFYFTKLPVDVALRLTVPVRDGQSLQLLEVYQKQQIDLQAGSLGDPEDLSINKHVDFKSDKLLLQVQGFTSVVFCIINWLGLSFLNIFIALILASIALALIHLTYNPTTIKVHTVRAVYYCAAVIGFAASLTWVYIFATEIIGILKFISSLYNVSDEILGLTVFALGNSLSDFISNYTIAKMGMPLMAFGACFGSPLLSFSSLGLSGLIVMSKKGLNSCKFDYSITLIISLILILFNFIALLVMLPRNNWVLDRKLGLFLISSWFVTTSINIIVENI